jgi:uncharacterized protein
VVFFSMLASCETARHPATSVDAQVEHTLCYSFLYGANGAPKDPEQALPHCEEGARLNVPSSVTLLAEMNYVGQAVPKDLIRARSLYERAAGLGHSHAQFMAGYMCWRGDGGPVDLQAAQRYLRAAANNGNEQAKKYLPALEHNQSPPPPKSAG